MAGGDPGVEVSTPHGAEVLSLGRSLCTTNHLGHICLWGAAQRIIPNLLRDYPTGGKKCRFKGLELPFLILKLLGATVHRLFITILSLGLFGELPTRQVLTGFARELAPLCLV